MRVYGTCSRSGDLCRINAHLGLARFGTEERLDPDRAVFEIVQANHTEAFGTVNRRTLLLAGRVLPIQFVIQNLPGSIKSPGNVVHRPLPRIPYKFALNIDHA